MMLGEIKAPPKYENRMFTVVAWLYKSRKIGPVYGVPLHGKGSYSYDVIGGELGVTVEQISKIPRSEMEKYKNFGTKTLDFYGKAIEKATGINPWPKPMPKQLKKLSISDATGLGR